MSKEFIENYSNFVEKITSEDSNNVESFIKRLLELQSQGLNIALLDTAADGLAGESGEFKDVVKKLKFHNKEWNEEVRLHLKKELR